MEISHVHSQFEDDLRRLGENLKIWLPYIEYTCLYQRTWSNYTTCILLFVSVYHVKHLEVASSSYQQVLEENRLLYNQVQDLKGNLSWSLSFESYTWYGTWLMIFFSTGTIRVYCRVRPFLPGQPNGQSTVDYIGENGNIMIVNPLKQGKDSRRIFTFNKVFGTSVTQGITWFLIHMLCYFL